MTHLESLKQRTSSSNRPLHDFDIMKLSEVLVRENPCLWRSTIQELILDIAEDDEQIEEFVEKVKTMNLALTCDVVGSQRWRIRDRINVSWVPFGPF